MLSAKNIDSRSLLNSKFTKLLTLDHIRIKKGAVLFKYASLILIFLFVLSSFSFLSLIGSADDFPRVTVISPVSGSIVSSSVSIEWSASDPHGLPLDIYLYYRLESNASWIRAVNASLNNTGIYHWDCSSMMDGHYMVMIQAVNEHGYIGRDQSEVFTIDNDNSPLAIAQIEIRDYDDALKQYVRDGDGIVLKVDVLHAMHLSRNDIWADLSDLGKQNEKPADTFDGSVATWNISNIDCMIDYGLIHIDVIVDHLEQATIDLIVDNIPPNITISSPQKGLYFLNKKMLPIQRSFIIGPCMLNFDIEEQGKIRIIEVFIDSALYKSIDDGSTQCYIDRKLFGRHRIRVCISDQVGFSDEDSFLGTFFII